MVEIKYIKMQTEVESNRGEYETNAEGLTREEEAKCFEAFTAFDKEKQGFIDIIELRIVLELMGRKMSEDEIFKLIQTTT